MHSGEAGHTKVEVEKFALKMNGNFVLVEGEGLFHSNSKLKQIIKFLPFSLALFP